MKKITNLLLTVLMLSSAVYAQSPAKKNKKIIRVEDKAILEKRVSDLNVAALSGNREQLNDLTAKQLNYGHSNGEIQDKSGFVDSLATRNWTFTAINIYDQTISINGKTAVVRQKLYGEAKNRGKAPSKLALGILQVWKKEGDKWLLYARQAFKLVPPNDVPPATK